MRWRAAAAVSAVVTTIAAPAAAATHLLVISGLGGEESYSTAFHDWSVSLISSALDSGLSPDNVVYLAEDPARDPETIDGPSRKETIEATLLKMGAALLEQGPEPDFALLRRCAETKFLAICITMLILGRGVFRTGVVGKVFAVISLALLPVTFLGLNGKPAFIEAMTAMIGLGWMVLLAWLANWVTRRVLLRSIETGGSSISDYVMPDGSDGAYQDERRVYARAGEPCLECGTRIKRIVVGARSTHFCPRCQH